MKKATVMGSSIPEDVRWLKILSEQRNGGYTWYSWPKVKTKTPWIDAVIKPCVCGYHLIPVTPKTLKKVLGYWLDCVGAERTGKLNIYEVTPYGDGVTSWGEATLEAIIKSRIAADWKVAFPQAKLTKLLGVAVPKTKFARYFCNSPGSYQEKETRRLAAEIKKILWPEAK